MSKKYENNCNFEKYGKFLLKGQGVCFSPKASKFLHQIQLSNSFHLIYGLFCHVQYFNSKLRKTESNWLQFPPLTYRSSLLIVQWSNVIWLVGRTILHVYSEKDLKSIYSYNDQ